MLFPWGWTSGGKEKPEEREFKTKTTETRIHTLEEK
jgi:hypothetical protein